MSITVLKEPIVFGSKENDPVKYVFCLAATENNRHLNAMVELVRLLEDPEFYSILETSQQSEEVFGYLSQTTALLEK
ncbi:PTS sugar transporter subunit IIA [Enterococcus termitis]